MSTANMTASTISRMFETTSNANQSIVTNQMLTRAYAWFAQRHPQMIVDLLNKQFLMNHGRPIIDDYVNGAISRHNAAIALAKVRDDQLDHPARSAEHKQRMADMVMAADSFLKLLRTELG